MQKIKIDTKAATLDSNMQFDLAKRNKKKRKSYNFLGNESQNEDFDAIRERVTR